MVLSSGSIQSLADTLRTLMKEDMKELINVEMKEVKEDMKEVNRKLMFMKEDMKEVNRKLDDFGGYIRNALGIIATRAANALDTDLDALMLQVRRPAGVCLRVWALPGRE